MGGQLIHMALGSNRTGLRIHKGRVGAKAILLWRVPPQSDATVWLRALPVLFPDGGYFYLEGTTEREIANWLSERAVPADLQIAAGTIWPKPDVHSVPLTSEFVESLAALIDRVGAPLPAIHVHVHDGQRVVLEWHDAFTSDPMYVSASIPAQRVTAFAARLGVGPPLLQAHT